MHPYTVKNYLWAVIIVLMLVVMLAGCSSTKVVAQKPQYCYTSQTIVTENGEKVNSKTQVECTDDQFKRLTSVRMGLADHCGMSTKQLNVGGKIVQTQVGSCMVLNSSGDVVGWEYIK